MLAFFKKRAVLVFIGLVFLSLFVWFAGPYFAFADIHPWGPIWARIVTIALIFAIWGVVALLKKFQAIQASAKLAAAATKPVANAPGGADAAQLRERFEEALAALKQNSRPGHSIYELPWYAIIGAPGSGKTTALVNSGLNFPLAQKFGKEALRGVGGTRNCDWWFTDEAVLLDTAGRYTTQDSDQGADSAGWKEFLALLRKYRKRRPLNGVIVAVSAADLMTQTVQEREQHIAAVRRRLDELNRELQVNLPVYTIVTKTDLIAGFTEYFDDLAQDGRAQVWGVTFPYEQTVNGQAAIGFPAEFDALLERLNARIFTRLKDERDTRRRAAAFAFPQQLAGIREALTRFVNDVFAGSKFDGRVLLRGVYFTSGTQEGTPIDRLMGAISRSFALGHDAVSASGGKGKAYFIECLLKEVMFAESGLAGVNRRFELQRAALQVAAYAAMVLFAVLGVIALSVSYGRNKTYLADVTKAAAQLQQLPAVDPDAGLEQAVPRLDEVRAVVDVANQYRSNVPWSMRWGLYQGDSVGAAAGDAYVRELDSALLPRVANALKQRLYASIADPDQLFVTLKAYLMLDDPRRLNKDELEALMDSEWTVRYAQAPEMRDALSSHFHGLLDHADQIRRIPADMSLVTQAREAIKLANVPRLMYSRLKLKYAGDTERAIRLDVATGLGADRVLARKSGRKMSEPISSLYTPAVFKEVSTLGAANLVREFAQDGWVLGDDNFSVQNTGRMAYQVLDVYEQDYIATWNDVLADVQLAPFQTLSQTVDALNILSAPTSPLRGLLVTVDANTFLIKPPDPNQGSVAKAGQAISGMFDRASREARAATGAPSTEPGARITAAFDPIHKLVTGPPGQAPIDNVLAQLGRIGQQLQSVGGGVGETDPLQAMTRAGSGEALRSLQQQAALLPPAVGALVAQIGGRGQQLAVGQARGELDNRYRIQVVNECNTIIAGRYPFNPRSSSDVPLADFARLFAAGGVFDSFFKENLAPLVDVSRSPWTWRSDASGAIGASQSMLRQFEVAQRIRDQFFRPGGSLPEVRFTVTPTLLDAGASRFTLETDGQSFDYRHGPERSFPAVWPGPSPGVAAVSFEDRTGARPNQAFEGPWAWFRLLDAGNLKQQSDVRYLADWRAGGHQAQVIVEAASIRNPFLKSDLRQFRCGG